tara:strand:- start:688 stop:1041 length:354 start_codon:yes stop_codon:yes gene_type:complete
MWYFLKRAEAESGMSKSDILQVPDIGKHLRKTKVGKNETYQVSEEGLAILKGYSSQKKEKTVRVLQRPINRRILVVEMDGKREKVFVRNNLNFSVGKQLDVQWRDRWEPTKKYRERS